MKQQQTSIDVVILHTDGAARGNPGHSGIGVVATDEQGNRLWQLSKYIGKATNNVAEYTALIEGLTRAVELQPRQIRVFMDSELVVKQIRGEYKVKDSKLNHMFEKVKKILDEYYGEIVVEHVSRQQNAEADKLANEAIDRAVRAIGE